MDSGYYAASTALMAQTQALDLVANNLSNTSTSGYRSQHSMFRSMLAKATGRPMSHLNKATNDYGVLGGSRLDLAQGGLERTGNDFDLGIEGPGFFVVQTPTGRFYTRNGGFHVAKGQLVAEDGSPVLGASGPIPIVPGSVSVSADGTISVNGALAGKLKLVDFKPGTALESVGKTYYALTKDKDGKEPKDTEIPATGAQVRQGVLESSNVNPVSTAVDLITVQRYADMMQRALSIFDSQFNRIATEELPRVG